MGNCSTQVYKINLLLRERSLCLPCVSQETIGRATWFFMRNAEAVLNNYIRLAIDGHDQIKPTMLDQADTLSTGKSSTTHAIITKSALSVYNFLKLYFLRSVEKTISWQGKVVGSSPPFAWMFRVYNSDTVSSLKWNATVSYAAHLVLYNLSKKSCRLLIDHGYTLVALLL